MSIAITVRRGDTVNNPVEAMTACHIDMTGLDRYTVSGDTATQNVYYVLGDAPSGDDIKSHEFTPSEDGKHTWNDVIFPVDGSWTLRLYKVGSPDTEVATQAVTVDAAS